MKFITRITILLLISSVLASTIFVSAQTVGTVESIPKERSFDVGMYMDARYRINLMLVVRRSNRVSIVVRDAQNDVLYEERVKRTTPGYWRKFSFDESKSGTYTFEISDGRQTIVRRIDVVDTPAVEPQRFVIYGPQSAE